MAVDSGSSFAKRSFSLGAADVARLEGLRERLRNRYSVSEILRAGLSALVGLSDDQLRDAFDKEAPSGTGPAPSPLAARMPEAESQAAEQLIARLIQVRGRRASISELARRGLLVLEALDDQGLEEHLAKLERARPGPAAGQPRQRAPRPEAERERVAHLIDRYARERVPDGAEHAWVFELLEDLKREVLEGA